MAFILVEFDFEVISSNNGGWGKALFRMGNNFRDNKLKFIFKCVGLLAIIAADIFIVELHQSDSYWTFIKYACVLLILIVNTLYVYQYKLRTLIRS